MRITIIDIQLEEIIRISEQKKEDKKPVDLPKGGIVSDPKKAPKTQGEAIISDAGLHELLIKASKFPKPKPQSKSKGKQRPVEARKDGGEWVRYESTREMAKAIGATPTRINTCIYKGHRCNGYEVRLANNELDDCLKEIEERNKQPYQPSKKP